MPLTGFTVYKTKTAGTTEMETVQSVASTQYTLGDMQAVVAGLATPVTATGKGTHIYQSMVTPAALLRPATFGANTATSTVLSEQVLLEPVAGCIAVLQSALIGNSAPPINANAVTGGSATTAIVTAAQFNAGAGDYVGGLLYIKELNAQRLITASTYTGGAYTFTFAPAAPAAVAAGMTAYAVPWSKGATGVRFNATTPAQGLDTSYVGTAGGHNKIEDVDLSKLFVYSSCPDLQ